MARWGGVMAIVVAAVMTLALPADADLLGGITNLIEETVDNGTDLVDDTVEVGTDLVDGTLGGTGIVDDTVDGLTDFVDGTTGTLTGAVDATTAVVTTTVDDAADALVPSADSDPTEREVTESGTTTSDGVEPAAAGPTASSAPTRPTTTTVPAPPPADGLTTSTWARSQLTDPAAERTAPATGEPSVLDSLTVLATATGLERPVPVVQAVDDSIYARLLSWLGGGGIVDLLAGPLLGLEILLRALLSAGSGLVAPTSLLAALVFVWLRESRGRQRRPVNAG